MCYTWPFICLREIYALTMAECNKRWWNDATWHWRDDTHRENLSTAEILQVLYLEPTGQNTLRGSLNTHRDENYRQRWLIWGWQGGSYRRWQEIRDKKYNYYFKQIGFFTLNESTEQNLGFTWMSYGLIDIKYLLKSYLQGLYISK